MLDTHYFSRRNTETTQIKKFNRATEAVSIAQDQGLSGVQERFRAGNISEASYLAFILVMNNDVKQKDSIVTPDGIVEYENGTPLRMKPIPAHIIDTINDQLEPFKETLLQLFGGQQTKETPTERQRRGFIERRHGQIP